MTVVIRAVSPASGMKRVRAMQQSVQADRQPGISPSSPSSSRTSSMVASAGGRIRSDSSRRVARRAARRRVRTPSSSAASAARERRLVAGLDGRLDGGVELVEPVERVVGDVVLALAQDPDDHAWPSSGSLGGRLLLLGSASRIVARLGAASMASRLAGAEPP